MHKKIEELLNGVAFEPWQFQPIMNIEGEDDGDQGGGDDGSAEASEQGEGEQGGSSDDQGSQSALADQGLFAGRKSDKGEEGAEGEQGEDKSSEASDRPDNIPEQFWDKDKGELKTEALLKSHKDTKSALDRLKRDKGVEDVPENSSDYFTEDLTFEEGDLSNLDAPRADDPVLQDWADVCHGMGIGPEKAKALAVEMYKKMDGKAPARIDRETEIEALGKNGNAIVDGVYTWLEGMERSGNLSESDIKVAADLSKTADGIRFLSRMRDQTGAEPIPLTATDGMSMSAQEWHQKYQAAVKAKDYAAQQKLDDQASKIWPDGVPRSDIPETRETTQGR